MKGCDLILVGCNGDNNWTNTEQSLENTYCRTGIEWENMGNHGTLTNYNGIYWMYYAQGITSGLHVDYIGKIHSKESSKQLYIYIYILYSMFFHTMTWDRCCVDPIWYANSTTFFSDFMDDIIGAPTNTWNSSTNPIMEILTQAHLHFVF